MTPHSLRRIAAMLLAVGALLFLPATLTPADEPLSGALGFEDVTSWQGLLPDTTEVRFGAQSGRWENLPATPRVSTRAFPANISDAEAISVWIHSSKAAGGCIAVILVSENPASEGADYYYDNVILDWTGWKEVQVPVSTMRIKRDPLGFDKITQFRFAATEYGCGEFADPELVLRFDDLKVIRGGADEGEDSTSAWSFGFEDVNFWKGFVRDTEIFRAGTASARWEETVTNNRIIGRNFPTDVSRYESMKIWIHSAKATNAQFAFVLMSENEKSDGVDYYSAVYSVNWTGWQEIVMPFATLKAVREPRGLHRINELRIASSGYGVGEANPETLLHFDDLRLIPSTATPVAAEGVPIGAMKWRDTVVGAIASAKERKQLVFIYAFTPESEECRRLEAEVLGQAAVASTLENFSMYRFNAQTDSKNASFFKVVRTPTLLVYTPAGSEVLRLVQMPTAQELPVVLESIRTNNKVY